MQLSFKFRKLFNFLCSQQNARISKQIIIKICTPIAQLCLKINKNIYIQNIFFFTSEKDLQYVIMFSNWLIIIPKYKHKHMKLIFTAEKYLQFAKQLRKCINF